MNAAAIAEVLNDVATLKRLAGENEFKAAAYERAARTLEGLSTPIPTDNPGDFLKELPAVGASILKEILALLSTGEMPERASLRKAIPPGLLEWLRIPGLGPKRIRKIHETLGITTLAELEARCADGSVAGLSGFGEKSAAKILASITWLKSNSDRCHADEAQRVADRFLAAVRAAPGVQAAEAAGSLRRGLETVGDVDILVAAPSSSAAGVVAAFLGAPGVVEVLAQGDTKAAVRAQEGRQVDLRVVDPASHGAALLYFTGSKDHNVLLRGRARDRGLGLNEYGLFPLDAKGETDFQRPAVAAAREEDIYRALGLNLIPPELREGRGETEWFAEHADAGLVEARHLRGVLHAHSQWSDGSVSVREMAEAAHARGYTYLGITDHSRAAAYANGLSIERVQAQWREIDAINAAYASEGADFQVFKGIESDILADGSLDYPDEILAGFDFVIASVHSQLDMPPDEMLARLLRAAANPHTRMIGHPTGRLLLRRPGSAVDLNPLIEACAAAGVVIETNANPWRLDLDWRHGRKARECGLVTSVNPDAHAPEEIDFTAVGLRIARKGWYGPERVLNAMTRDAFAAWCRRRRPRA